MAFPASVHSVLSAESDQAWPVEGQGRNECGCTAAANALNLVSKKRQFSKDRFVREAGLLFQRNLGGSPSPLTGWLIRRHGFGTHFGNLSHTNYEQVLCELIDLGVPVVVEIGVVKIAGIPFYGQHAIVLVGYKNADSPGQAPFPEEFYFVDSEWPALGKFDLAANNVVDPATGAVTTYPGNRTMGREEFRANYITRFYFPVFPSQAAHDAWFLTRMTTTGRVPILGPLREWTLSGSYDVLRADAKAPAAA
jgi:hypothetical protein